MNEQHLPETAMTDAELSAWHHIESRFAGFTSATDTVAARRASSWEQADATPAV